MTDRPIIFSAPMVQAILSGRKSMTRRVLKPQPTLPWGSASHAGKSWWTHDSLTGDVIETWRLRYAVGDRLYVREAHSLPLSWTENPNAAYIGHVFYPASVDAPFRSPYLREKPSDHGRLRPSIHMPRWASRLTLTVTDVRVQRLQEISEGDAWAEGCKQGDPWDSGEGFFPAEEPSPDGKGFIGWDCARDWYADLWNSLHGPDAWDANPWIVAVSFSVQHGNIDQIGGPHD